jgi:hypothetical protein
MTRALTLGYVIWGTTLVIQLGIALLMARKKLFRELPIFFSYTVFHVVRSVTLFYVRQHSSLTTYSYAYWSAELISAVLGFAVIYEVFSMVLEPYPGLRRLGMMLLGWAAVVMVILSIAAAASPGASQPGMIAAVFDFERSIRIIQCGLMAFLFIFASTLSLSWKHYSFGIALGFGIFATVDLIAVAVRAQVGSAAAQSFALLKPGSYLMATAIWTAYLLMPAAEPAEVSSLSRYQLERWNRTLLELLAR